MKVLFDVPLYTQSWDLREWNNLGYKSWGDAEYWQRSCCGILCLNEIATFLNGEKYSTPDLIKRGQDLDGYSDEHGWSHDGLVRLAKHLGLKAEKLTIGADELKKALDKKKLPIISVKWAFRSARSLKERLLFWKKYGGHLVVIVGYDDGGFYVNHTSVRPEYNWHARHIPFKQFSAGYTGRTILIWK